MAKINIGNLNIEKLYVGALPVDKIFLGNTLIYESTPQLLAPTISLTDNTLSIEEVENTEYYDIYADGVLKESVPAVESAYNITIHTNNKGYGNIAYRINGGTWIYAPTGRQQITNTYTDVKKLEVAMEDQGGVDDITFYTTQGGTIYKSISEPATTIDNPLDVTEFLVEGCYIDMIGDD